MKLRTMGLTVFAALLAGCSSMRIPYGDGTIDIDVRDWLHLQEDGVILNHSKMKKFGVLVGELVITIIKDFP